MAKRLWRVVTWTMFLGLAGVILTAICALYLSIKIVHFAAVAIIRRFDSKEILAK